MLAVAEREQLPVQEARAGDASAWHTLFKRYQLPLYVYVFELVRDEQTSLDVVQETFINAVRHIGSLRDDVKFGSWLFGIAHQKCIQQWRRDHRQNAVLAEIEETPAEPDRDPRELLIRAELEAGFMKLLNQLPLPQRSVLLLHFVEDFSLEEIAGAGIWKTPEPASWNSALRGDAFNHKSKIINHKFFEPFRSRRGLIERWSLRTTTLTCLPHRNFSHAHAPETRKRFVC